MTNKFFIKLYRFLFMKCPYCGADTYDYSVKKAICSDCGNVS